MPCLRARTEPSTSSPRTTHFLTTRCCRERAHGMTHTHRKRASEREREREQKESERARKREREREAMRSRPAIPLPHSSYLACYCWRLALQRDTPTIPTTSVRPTNATRPTNPQIPTILPFGQLPLHSPPCSSGGPAALLSCGTSAGSRQRTQVTGC